MDAVKFMVVWLFIGLVSIINGHPAPQIFDSPDAKIDIHGGTTYELTTTPVPTISFAETTSPPTTLKPGPTTIDPRAACGGLKGFLRLCDVPEDVRDEPKHTRNQRDVPKETKTDPKDAVNKKVKDTKPAVTEGVPSGISKVQPQAVTKPNKRDVKEVTRVHSSSEKAKPQKAATKKINTPPPTTTTAKKITQ